MHSKRAFQMHRSCLPFPVPSFWFPFCWTVENGIMQKTFETLSPFLVELEGQTSLLPKSQASLGHEFFCPSPSPQSPRKIYAFAAELELQTLTVAPCSYHELHHCRSLKLLTKQVWVSKESNVRFFQFTKTVGEHLRTGLWVTVNVGWET